MVKAIFYKEWLKLRWPFFGMLAISLIVPLNIFLKVSHELKFIDQSAYWYRIIFLGYQFYEQFMYVPLLIGIVLAIAQFVPEKSLSRLKLTMHLPIEENRILTTMLLTGISGIIMLYLLSFVSIVLTTSYFFPAEIVNSVLNTILPWYIAGLAAYLSVSMIIVEPVWRHRIFLIVLVYGFIDLLLRNYGFSVYGRSWPWFFLFTTFFVTATLLSGHRFKRGVMA